MKKICIKALVLFMYSCGYELNNEQPKDIKTNINNHIDLNTIVKNTCDLLDKREYQMHYDDKNNERENFCKKSKNTKNNEIENFYKKSKNTKNIKNVILNVIIPGFTSRSYDNYSNVLVNLYLKHIQDKETTDWQTVVMYRWDVSGNLSYDNLSIEEQCEVLKAQFDKTIDRIIKEYNKNININVNFYGESYGGKICILFVNDILKKVKNSNIKINNIYTLHSPLYTNMWAKFLIKNYFEASKSEKEKIGILLKLLEIDKCETAFKIMMNQDDQNVRDIRIEMENLLKNNIKITHIIGNPKFLELEIDVIEMLKRIFPLNTNLKLRLPIKIEISQIHELLKVLKKVIKSINNADNFITFLKKLNNSNSSELLELKKVIQISDSIIDTLESSLNENDSIKTMIEKDIIPAVKCLIEKLIEDKVFEHISDCVVSNEDALGPDYNENIKNNNGKIIKLPYGGQCFISQYLVHIGNFKRDKFEKEIKDLRIWN